MQLVGHELGKDYGQHPGSEPGENHGLILQIVGPDAQEHGCQDVGNQGQIQVDQCGGIAAEGIGHSPHAHAEEIQPQGFFMGPVFLLVLERGQVQGKGLVGGPIGEQGGILM